MGISKQTLAILLVNHKRFYKTDEALPEEMGRSAEYAELILKRTFPDSRKLKQEDMGKNLLVAYGIIYDHAMGMIGTKTAIRRLFQLK